MELDIVVSNARLHFPTRPETTLWVLRVRRAGLSLACSRHYCSNFRVGRHTKRSASLKIKLQKEKTLYSNTAVVFGSSVRCWFGIPEYHLLELYTSYRKLFLGRVGHYPLSAGAYSWMLENNITLLQKTLWRLSMNDLKKITFPETIVTVIVFTQATSIKAMHSRIIIKEDDLNENNNPQRLTPR